MKFLKVMMPVPAMHTCMHLLIPLGPAYMASTAKPPFWHCDAKTHVPTSLPATTGSRYLLVEASHSVQEALLAGALQRRHIGEQGWLQKVEVAVTGMGEFVK